MLVFYRCPSCGFEARVSGKTRELEFLVNQKHDCPICVAGLNRVSLSSARKAESFSFQEFYSAVNGLGLPNETVTHIEPVVAMLKACQIIDVDASEVDERCIIHSVTLDNGVTLHMAASGHGAAVYKATRRKDDASSRTKFSLHEQYFRGQGSAEKHGARRNRDTDSGGEVHRRLREDSDEAGGDDRRSTVPSPPGCERQGEGRAEMAGEANRREAEWPTVAEKEDPEEEGKAERGSD